MVFTRSRYSLFLILVLSWAFPVQAQNLEIGGSPNVVGSGARAMGMGGAFIALADDATAASWNPGGLVQLERPELSLVYEFSRRGESLHGNRNQSYAHGDFDVDVNALNYLSAVYPLPMAPLGRNVVVSLNLQRRYDLARELDFGIRGRGSGLSLVQYRYAQAGSLYALSPAAAFEITKRLSLGVAMNLYRDGWQGEDWREEQRFSGVRISGGSLLYNWGGYGRRYRDFHGENFTLGLLWNPIDRLRFGAVYHSPLVATVRRTTDSQVLTPGFGAATLVRGYRNEKLRYEFPEAWGVGAAYRFPGDKLTVSMDITRRAWNDFLSIDSLGNRVSPVTGQSYSRSRTGHLYTVRAGMEYVFFDRERFVQNVLPSIRAGVLYDPEPAVAGGVDDIYGFTLGLGLLVRDKVNIDVAYQFRRGDGVRRHSLTNSRIDSLAESDIRQHSLFLSTVIYF